MCCYLPKLNESVFFKEKFIKVNYKIINSIDKMKILHFYLIPSIKTDCRVPNT